MKLPDRWPNARHSRFIESGDMCWHVQNFGHGPTVMLLHGTGSSTHSWAPLAKLLENHAELIIPDLPGQGFSSPLAPEQTTLPGICAQLALLLEQLGKSPQVIVGHSAGAAIAATMALDGWAQPERLIAINGAFLPFGSVAAPVFSRLAKALANTTLVPAVTSWHGYFERPIRNLLKETGSRANPEMINCYQSLLKRRSHIEGTLRMMAGWDLKALKRALPGLKIPLDMIVCENDKTLSPWQLERLTELVAAAELHRLSGLGHLGHEEAPKDFVPIILRGLAHLDDHASQRCAPA